MYKFISSKKFFFFLINDKEFTYYNNNSKDKLYLTLQNEKLINNINKIKSQRNKLII